MAGSCKVCHYSLVVEDETVCRRCARNFTRAELHHVIILAAAYFVLCRFSYYLLTGKFFGELWKGNLFGPFDLSGWGLFPVNLADFPSHLFTLGIVLALVLVTPVLVATLFGPRAGIAVALAGGLFAALPGLFLMTVPAAYIAGTRGNGRLGVSRATWVAAALPLAYGLALTSAMAGGLGVAFGVMWLAAFVVIATHVKLLLYQANRQEISGTFLAKLIVPETLAVLALFYFTVGFDTVEYEGVRSRAAGTSGRFSQGVGPDARSMTPEEVTRVVKERTEEMSRLRERSMREFEDFTGIFPRSPRTPNALYEMAELWNMKLYLGGGTPLSISAGTDRISPEAAELYKRIVRDFNDSIAAAYARLKLADFAAQHGEVGEAAREYDEDIVEVYHTHVAGDFKAPAYSPAELETAWRTQRADRAQQQLAYYHVMKVARERSEFIARNTDYNNIPLALYLQADPRSEDFLETTKAIPEWFPHALVVDNVLWDRACWGGLKPETLKALYEAYPHGDVAARALLELADKYARELHEPETARKYYDALQSEFGATPEAERARQELGGLKKE